MTKTRHLVSFALLGVMACDPGPRAPQAQATGGSNDFPLPVRKASPVTGTMRARQKASLDRIRQSNPEFQAMQRVILNEENELGIILDGNVNVDTVPALMRIMLAQMAREFPNQDFAVIAYGPTDPPIMIGTGRIDGRSGQMTYTRGF